MRGDVLVPISVIECGSIYVCYWMRWYLSLLLGVLEPISVIECVRTYLCYWVRWCLSLLLSVEVLELMSLRKVFFCIFVALSLFLSLSCLIDREFVQL